jgi:hypothetical protein
MSGTEQVLILAGVPILVAVIIWGLASIGGPQARKRYRPGRPYDFTPVWYLANHRGEAAGATPSGGAPGSSVGAATGGASDRW